MGKRLERNGFTIIEVMIVLAIAGLIMLIVFLAVPALQRAHRNNERKHDVALLAVQRQSYDEDNGTTMATNPVSATCTDDGGDSGSFGNFCQYITQGMAYYTPSQVTISNNGYTKPATIPSVTPEQLITETYLTCNETMTEATTNGAGPYDVAIIYALEGNGGRQIDQCMATSVTGRG